MNPSGLLLGLFLLLAIGFGFFWVIKIEYYLGAEVWRGVLAAGILVCLASLLLANFWASAILGILGGSIVWGATELPAQADRARRGLFPQNPKRVRQEEDKGQ